MWRPQVKIPPLLQPSTEAISPAERVTGINHKIPAKNRKNNAVGPCLAKAENQYTVMTIEVVIENSWTPVSWLCSLKEVLFSSLFICDTSFKFIAIEVRTSELQPSY